MSPERVSVREGHSMYRSKDRKDAGTNNRETQGTNNGESGMRNLEYTMKLLGKVVLATSPGHCHGFSSLKLHCKLGCAQSW